MAKERIEISKNGDNEMVEYTKRWEEDGLTHRLSVEEVDGGYIVTENVYGRRKSAGEDSQYIDETTKKVTMKNPLKQKQVDDSKKMSPLISSIKSNFGDIQMI